MEKSEELVARLEGAVLQLEGQQILAAIYNDLQLLKQAAGITNEEVEPPKPRGRQKKSEDD